MLQQAVASVKENASDVFGALKDRVQAISIKDKFGKFTPKDVRRHKIKSQHKKKNIQPLFVDNTIFDFDNPLARRGENNDEIEEAVAANSETGSVESEDLIDLSDTPTQPDELHTARSLPSIPPKPVHLHPTSSANTLLEHLTKPPLPPPRNTSKIASQPPTYNSLGFNPFEIQPQTSNQLNWNSDTLMRVQTTPTTFMIAPSVPDVTQSSQPQNSNLVERKSPQKWEKFD
uniref:Uncharacterized protein n=1 Tax=Acrobeloides nanus TaxID=290746 RepID=A0A914D2G0_9BILA